MLPCQAHPDVPGGGVFQCVMDEFLHDTKEVAFRLGVKPVSCAGGGKVYMAVSGILHILTEYSDCVIEWFSFEICGQQSPGDISNRLDDLFKLRPHFYCQRFHFFLIPTGAFESVEVKPKYRKTLNEIIVQLCSDFGDYLFTSFGNVLRDFFLKMILIHHARKSWSFSRN